MAIELDPVFAEYTFADGYVHIMLGYETEDAYHESGGFDIDLGMHGGPVKKVWGISNPLHIYDPEGKEVYGDGH